LNHQPGDQLVEGGPAGSTADDATTAQNAIVDAFGFLIGFVTSPASCDEVVLDHSYLRVPLPMRKYGGGLRVKRLLMVDPSGITEGYPAVYGTEYKYAMVDDQGNELSSGVATNEPASISAENPLVRPLERFSQGWPSRVIAGRDREQSEGPLGMSIYPAPSVGYSQVIISNIGQTQLGVNCTPNGAGFIAKEFNTAKDDPVKFEMTSIHRAFPSIYIPVITPWVTTIVDRKSVTQGFVLKFNNMHGQIKSETTYSGNVSDLLGLNPAAAAYSSRSEYEYYGAGEEIPTLVDRYGHTELRPLGQEMDVTIEGRVSKDEMDDAAVEVDAGVGLPLGPPSVSAAPSVTYINTTIRSHTTTKVITYPAILKRTHTKVDGIHHMTEPIAFDPATGEPAIVRTHDGFLPNLGSTADLASATAGVYTKHTIPAHMPYPNLGQIAKGERKVVTSSTVNFTCTVSNPGRAEVSVAPGAGNGVCDLLGALCQGDLLAFYPSGSPVARLYHLERVDPVGPTLHLLQTAQSSMLPTTSMTRMEIIRSGCSNQLGAPAGEYTVYDDGQLNLTSDWTLRQLFVDALNSTLWGPVAADHANGAPYSIHPVSVPVGLPFLNDQQMCGPFIGTVNFEPVQQGQNTVPALISGIPVPPEGFDYCDRPFAVSFAQALNSWGSFALDPSTGQIVYKPANSPCFPIPITCPQLCPAEPEYVVEKVVSCNATVYSDIWDYDLDAYGIPGGYNLFETGKRGQWRPDSSYAFREVTYSGGLNRNTGWFDMPFFDYDDVDNNDPNRWIQTNYVVAYSPDGQALEEENALGIRSCSKFGYDRQLPYLVAQNSASPLVLFESFEKQYLSGTYLEDRVDFSWNSFGVINSTAAHAGKKSFSSSNASAFLYRSGSRSLGYTLAAPQAMQVKGWFRSKDVTGFIDPIVAVTLNGTPAVPMKVVARVGEWVLCEATVSLPFGSSAYSIDITCVNVTANSGTTWIDDVRVQPKDAQMTAYVYDPNNYRLLATFDDQHFGMYYQYNDEGKLVRKLIETERGLRTVQETQYNTPQDQNRQWP
jgi:hypothetical protein